MKPGIAATIIITVAVFGFVSGYSIKFTNSASELGPQASLGRSAETAPSASGGYGGGSSGGYGAPTGGYGR
jgi:hypothetical protein